MDNLPKYQDLILPMLKVLSRAGGPMTNEAIETAIVADLAIPNSLKTMIHSGKRTELQYRLAWARTKAKSMGWVSSPSREKWCITNQGVSSITLD